MRHIMQNYVNTETGLVLTQASILLRGLKLDTAYLRSIGYAPIEYHYPVQNQTLYTIIPDGEPHPKADDPQTYIQDFTIVPRELPDARAAMKERVTARRWQAETGGITVYGTQVLTGLDDQNRISTAIQGMRDAGLTSVDFKAASGWVELTLDQLVAIAGAIAEHVQACFSRERALHEAVDAAQSVAELAALDIESGWPNSGSAA
jgi:hypothetical protein